MLRIAELKFAMRFAWENRNSSLLSICVMTTGLVVVITMLTFVNGFLWSDLRVKNGDRLYHVEWVSPDRSKSFSNNIATEDYIAFRQSSSFDDMAAFATREVAIGAVSELSLGKRYKGAEVSFGFFDIIEAKPLMGRLFSESDESVGATSEAVISHQLWKTHFGGDANVVGQSALFNGEHRTIIAVMPAGFRFPVSQDVWIPKSWRGYSDLPRAQMPALEVFGALSKGVEAAAAKAELESIAERLSSERADSTLAGLRLEVKRYAHEFLGRTRKAIMLMMLFFSVLVLMVACANVSNLLMLRAGKREQELAIRSALGGGRFQLVTLIILDGVAVTAVSCAIAIFLSMMATGYVWNVLSALDLPYWFHVRMEFRIVAATLGLALASGIVSSVVPALRATSRNSFRILKDDSRGSSSARVGKLAKSLTMLQVAISGMLVLTALTVVTLMRQLEARPKPFDMANANVVEMRFAPQDGFSTRQDVANFFERLESQLAQDQGISSASFCSSALASGGNRMPVALDGDDYSHADEMPTASVGVVASDFFETIGLEALAGRGFGELDTADSERVAIASWGFVTNNFAPGSSVVGSRIRIAEPGSGGEWLTIVGIYPDLLPRPLEGEPVNSAIYLPSSQRMERELMLVAGGGKRAAEKLSSAIRELAPRYAGLFPTGQVSTFEREASRQNVSFGILAYFFGGFGLASLLVASIGLYAVVQSTSEQKVREYGIRMAIGASSGQILATVMKGILPHVLVAVAIGFGLGYAGSERVQEIFVWSGYRMPLFLYPLMLGAVLACTALASLVPAFQASRLQPSVALSRNG